MMRKYSDSDIEKSQGYLDAANNLYSANEKTAALRLAKKSLKLNPENSNAMLLLAKLSWENGDNETADSYFKEAIKSSISTFGEASRCYADFLMDQHRESEALGYLRQYIEVGNWTDLPYFNTFIRYANELNKSAEILPTLKKVWQKSFLPMYGFQYAHQLRITQNLDEAIQLLEFITQSTPKPDYFNELGICLVNQLKYEEAVKAFRNAIGDYHHYDGDNPQHGEDFSSYGVYWANLGFCYLQLDQKDLAKIAIDIALMEDDSYLYPWDLKVQLLVKNGDFDEAIQIAQKTIDRFSGIEKKKSDDLSNIYRKQIEALANLNRKPEVIAVLEVARQKYPGNELFYFLETDYLVEYKQYEKALSLLVNANQYTFDLLTEAVLIKLYVFCLFKLGKEKEISKILSEFLKKDSAGEYLHNEYEIWVGSDDITPEEESRLIELVQTEIEKIDPGFPWFAMEKASRAIFDSNLDLARSLLEGINTELVKNNEKAHIYNGLGYVMMLDRKFEKAKVLFQKVLEIDVKEDTYYLGPDLSFLSFYQNGNWKAKAGRGIELMNIAFGIKSIALVNLASIAIAQGDFDQATKYAYKLLSQQTDNDRMFGLGYELLGYISASKNEPQAAEAAWRLAIDANVNKEDMESIILQLPQKK